MQCSAPSLFLASSCSRARALSRSLSTRRSVIGGEEQTIEYQKINSETPLWCVSTCIEMRHKSLHKTSIYDASVEALSLLTRTYPY